MPAGRARRAIAGVIVLAVLIIAGVVVAAVVFLNSGRALAWAESRASRALGHEVDVAGNLTIAWSLSPRIVIQDVRIANADWGKADTLASIGTLSARVDLPSLLVGDTRLEDVDLKDARLNLERSAKGRANWALPEDAGGSDGLPVIESLHIAPLQIRYRGPGWQQPMRLGFSTFSASLTGSSRRLKANAAGQTGNDRRLELQVTTELAGDAPRPLEASITYGQHHGSVQGKTGADGSLAGLQAKVSVQGPSLSQILPIEDEAANLPAYQLAFELRRNGNAWVAESLEAALGVSDAAGTLSVSSTDQRYTIDADLRSDKIDFVQLFGGSSGSGATRIPSATLGLLDAELSWTAKAVYTRVLTVQDVELDTALRQGKLDVEPLRFAVAGGSGEVKLTLNSGAEPPAADLEVDVSNVDLRKALERADVDREGFGKLDVELTLKGDGGTVGNLLGSANGDFAAVMRGGRIDQALMQKARANLGSLLAAMSSEGDVVPLRCTIADARVEQGLMQFTRLLLDTDKVRVVGDGTIDLADYGLDLLLVPRNKDFSLISGQPPVHLRGTLAEPSVTVDTSAALGSLATPIELGLAEDADCAALAKAARQGINFDQ